MTNKETFEKLVAENKDSLTPKFILSCIELAKLEMREGRITVENYYATKKALLETLETANQYVH
jgi:hypothetical protein